MIVALGPENVELGVCLQLMVEVIAILVLRDRGEAIKQTRHQFPFHAIELPTTFLVHGFGKLVCLVRMDHSCAFPLPPLRSTHQLKSKDRP